MSLIVILAALGLQWYMGIRFTLADFDWFKPYVSFLQSNLEKTGVWKSYFGLAVIVLPVVLVVWIVNGIFGDGFFHLFSLLFSAAVLWYCVDARSIDGLLSNYFAGNKSESEVKDFIGSALPKTKAGIARKVSNTIFVNSLHRLFSLIFWYLILGPVGVALYFMVYLVALGAAIEAKAFSGEAKLVQGVLDWVPVRLAGLSFGLMGSFGKVFVYWMKNIVTGLEKAEELVTHYGLLANGHNPRESKDADHKECEEAAELVFRAVIVWLVLLAAVTLASLL